MELINILLCGVILHLSLVTCTPLFHGIHLSRQTGHRNIETGHRNRETGHLNRETGHLKRETGQIARILEELQHSNSNTEQVVSRDREEFQGEEMPERAQPCISIHYLMVLKNQFKSRIDPNDDGKATFEEIRDFLRHYKPDVTSEAVNKFIERRDVNGNGIIELIPEYVLDITTPDYTLGGAKEWFNLEDSNGDGLVSRQELLTIAQNVGMGGRESENAVDSYYMSMDTNNDQHLSWDEYRALYSP